MARPDPEPTPQECEAAVRRATVNRAARYRDDPALTPAAIAERVTGLPGLPTPGEAGWWRVGLIQDTIADTELDVWYRARGLAVRERPRPVAAPPTPSYARLYNDGQHGWLDAETGRAADLAAVQRLLGVDGLAVTPAKGSKESAPRAMTSVPVLMTWRQFEAQVRAQHPEDTPQHD